MELCDGSEHRQSQWSLCSHFCKAKSLPIQNQPERHSELCDLICSSIGAIIAWHGACFWWSSIPSQLQPRTYSDQCSMTCEGHAHQCNNLAQAIHVYNQVTIRHTLTFPTMCNTVTNAINPRLSIITATCSWHIVQHNVSDSIGWVMLALAALNLPELYSLVRLWFLGTHQCRS